MATLQQPHPLNHPPPQPSSQPPRKKLRPRNAKPKLTLDQITNNDVVQSALRIGRHARANLPKPGDEPQALDKLLNRMAGWAHQVDPQYSLAEFVVAAQSIAGNRELRPMLGVFRLAELREVTGDDHVGDVNKEQKDGNEDGGKPAEAENAGEGPMHADVGPVEADVGPEDDEWDELDIVPDEAIEVRPLLNGQSAVSDRKEENLSAEVQVRIEQNRLSAIERRKAVMSRLKADRKTDKTAEKRDASAIKSSARSEKGASADDSDAPLRQPVEKEKQAKEIQVDDDVQPAKSNLGGLLQSCEAPDAKLASSEQEKNLSERLKDDGECHMKTSISGEGKSGTARTENDSFQSKEDKHNENVASPQTDALNGAPQTSEVPEKTKQQKSECDGGSYVSEATEGICKAKTDMPDLKKSKQITSASNSRNDEDIDMEILAEFEEGDET